MDMASVAFLKQAVLLLFFVIFSGVVVWAIRMPTAEAEMMRHLPLASDELPAERGGGPRG